MSFSSGKLLVWKLFAVAFVRMSDAAAAGQNFYFLSVISVLLTLSASFRLEVNLVMLLVGRGRPLQYLTTDYLVCIQIVSL